MHDSAHPGAVLTEWLGVSRLSLSKVLNENGGISPDLDLRLSEALATSQGFWYRMQAQWDMAQANCRN
jgi:addiction module HigA family antidote